MPLEKNNLLEHVIRKGVFSLKKKKGNGFGGGVDLSRVAVYLKKI